MPVSMIATRYGKSRRMGDMGWTDAPRAAKTVQSGSFAAAIAESRIPHRGSIGECPQGTGRFDGGKLENLHLGWKR